MTENSREASFEIWRLVTSIYRMWYREAEKRLTNAGLSIMEYRILRQLTETGQQPMVNLAEKNMITQGWVTSLVDRLEMKGYAERVRSSTDRRIVNITYTPKGLEFYKGIMEMHEEFIARTLEFMEPAERDNLRSLLCKVEDQLLNTYHLLDTGINPEIKE